MHTPTIPVTLISGFLGAGKTTLLNTLIAQNPTTKFAIIENEFGEIGIDSQLIVQQKECVFEINQGCICCSVNHSLSRTLQQLMELQDSFDHLLIEATGIADPAGIASTFLSQQKRQSTFQLTSTLCLVDASFIEEILAEGDDTASRQIAFADVILLNKTDRVKKERVEKIRQLVQDINPYAQIRSGQQGNFGATDLLQLQANQDEYILQKNKTIPSAHHHHHATLVSHSFSFDTPFDLDKFKIWVYRLLSFQSEGIYRIKGILYTSQEPRPIIFQSVKTQFVFSQGEDWDTAPKESKLVFIGKNLNRRIFEKHLKSCLTKIN